MATIAKLSTMFTADGSAFSKVATSIADQAKKTSKINNSAYKATGSVDNYASKILDVQDEVHNLGVVLNKTAGVMTRQVTANATLARSYADLGRAVAASRQEVMLSSVEQKSAASTKASSALPEAPAPAQPKNTFLNVVSDAFSLATFTKINSTLSDTETNLGKAFSGVKGDSEEIVQLTLAIDEMTNAAKLVGEAVNESFGKAAEDIVLLTQAVEDLSDKTQSIGLPPVNLDTMPARKDLFTLEQMIESAGKTPKPVFPVELPTDEIIDLAVANQEAVDSFEDVANAAENASQSIIEEVQIVSDATGAVKQIAAAQQDLAEKTSKTAKANKEGASSFSLLKSTAKVAAVALIAVFSADYVKGVLEGITANYRFAKSIGVTTNAVYATQQAFRDLGLNVEDANATLLELGRTISAAGSGGDAAVSEALSRIGLSAQSLAQMNPDAQLRSISEGLSRVTDANTRAALATQIFGSRAAEILPLLSEGGKAFDDAASKSNAMGNAIGDNRAAQIEKLGIQWENFKATIQGVGVTIASELVPFLTDLISKLPSLGLTAKTVTSAIKSAFATGGLLIQFLQGIYQFGIGIAKSVQFAFIAILTGALGLLSKAVKAINYASEQLGQGPLIDSSGLDVMFEAARKTGRETASEVAEAFGKIGEKNALQRFSEQLDFIRNSADNLGEKIDKKTRSTGQKLANINMALFQRGSEVFNETRTPLEKFSSKVQELDKLVKTGAITWETYSRAAANATNELDKAYELTRMGFSGAVRSGTNEAYSLILKAQQQEQIAREDPQKRMVRLLEQGQLIDKGIQKAAQETAAAIKNLKVVKI